MSIASGVSPGYVLIVDDDPDARAILSVVLNRIGARVEMTDNGRTAIEMIQQEPPILILLDLMMPGMNGFEVLYWLRSHSEFSHIPVFVVSAYVGNAPMPELTGTHVVPKAEMRVDSMKQAISAVLENHEPPDLLSPVTAVEREDQAAVREAIIAMFSRREMEVLRLMAQGLDNEAIAAALTISPNTVKSHVGAILAKFNVSNRRQAVARARILGLFNV